MTYSHYAMITTAVLCAALSVHAQETPVASFNQDQSPIANVFPATDGDEMSYIDTENNTQPQDDDTFDDLQSEEGIELELVTRGIYQCTTSSGKIVFVDEDARTQYPECLQIRAPHYQQVPTDSDADRSPCSGAIVYQGSTYIFTDKEPCPIPDDIFQARRPIEANPEYYTQPQP